MGWFDQEQDDSQPVIPAIPTRSELRLACVASLADSATVQLVVVEKPIIDMQEILRALDPIHGRAHQELGELRRDKLLTTGVAIRTEHSAPGDAFTLYCSLNRDTISALRHGDTGSARELREHAQRIEQETLAPWLMEITEGGASWSTSDVEPSSRTDPTRTWLDRALYAQHVDEAQDVAEPIWTAVNEVADVRHRYTKHGLGAQVTTGRVWKIDRVLSELRPEGPSPEASFAFLTDEVLAAGLRLGDPVVIRHEEVGPGVLLTMLERGLEKGASASRISGQPLPRHLDELLDAVSIRGRTRSVRPMRRFA